ncbi:MAG: class I SAM-dependent rRNA methyltransferase [Clostridia bacterium]|nr:class I SAM-dependent rRNA methyltransferase [Clostridia bacterium]
MSRPYAEFTVSQKAERSLRSGHPWVYADEVRGVAGEYSGGDIVDVISEKGRWLGAGFVNDESKIRVRLVSRNANDKFDENFWERRIRYAVSYRKTVMGSLDTCRLIYGEADSFPGFTVDKYEDLLVTQVLSLGVEVRKDMLYRILIRVLAEEGQNVRGILERCDVPVRKKEGLEEYKAFYRADGIPAPEKGEDAEARAAKVTILENGLYYDIDCLNGQKTGYFLDQKFNRAAAARIGRGLNVLDCFCNIGGFSLNCAAGGAAHVTGVDISELAVAAARAGAKKNGLTENCEFVAADVFDMLTDLASCGKKPYDFIILDPPAFTKSRETAKDAYRGYKDINLRAMRALPRGGYLATCSCSHFMTDEMFRQMLTEAAADASVSLRQIEQRLAAPDHPVLWGVPETEYLKFYLFQVV